MSSVVADTAERKKERKERGDSMMIQHVLRAQQFEPKVVKNFLTTAIKARHHWDNSGYPELLARHFAVNLFFQSSTRTHASSRLAEMLGGMTILFDSENPGQFSSVYKGETLEDTVITFEKMVPDPRRLVIVVRHNDPDAAERMAQASCGAHIINAGCGKSGGQHPTQALLDLLTIFRFGQARGVVDINSIGQVGNHAGRKPFRVLLIGDLWNGRTVRSLVYLLAKTFPWVEFHFFSPPSLPMGDDILDWLQKHKIPFHRSTKPKEFDHALHSAHVVYMTRIQEEDLGPEDKARSLEYQRSFRIDKPRLALLKRDAIIMHPLPRNTEIAGLVDADPRAVYFTKQIRNGVVTRLALLMMILLDKYKVE